MNQVITPIENKAVARVKAKKPTKKQAVLAALIRYKEMAQAKIKKVTAKNEPLIKDLEKELEKLEKDVEAFAQTLVDKFSKGGFKPDKDSLQIDIHLSERQEYCYMDIQFRSNGFDISHTNSYWKDNKTIQQLFKNAAKVQKRIDDLSEEISKAKKMLFEYTIKEISKKFNASMSTAGHLSDMEVAVAIVEDKSNVQSIDTMINKIIGGSDE